MGVIALPSEDHKAEAEGVGDTLDTMALARILTNTTTKAGKKDGCNELIHLVPSLITPHVTLEPMKYNT